MFKAHSVSIVCGAIVIAGSCQLAHGNDVKVEGRVNCSKLTDACFIEGMRIKGDIDAQTVEKTRSLIEELHRNSLHARKQVRSFSVELDSPGGNLTAALALGRTLRREQMGATIAGAFSPLARGICFSACSLVFAGAVHRAFNESASSLGIHRPYLETPPQEVSQKVMAEAYAQTLQGVRLYLREMNVSERLADEMFRTDPESVRLLNEKSAVSYGMMEWDPIYQEISDVQEAKKLGLERREYMKRRARGLKDCEWLSPYDEAPRDEWLSCYSSVMTNASSAPRPPPGSFGLFDRVVDPRDWITRVHPRDWSRFPYR
jgi:ATP-dependent protease ClpP protease subunit